MKLLLQLRGWIQGNIMFREKKKTGFQHIVLRGDARTVVTNPSQ